MRMRMNLRWVFSSVLMVGMLAVAGGEGGCQTTQKKQSPESKVQSAETQEGKEGGEGGKVSETFEKEGGVGMLRELWKGHSDKIQLSWFASLPFKTLEEPVKTFALQMGETHKVFLKRLEKWANEHDVSVKFKVLKDLPSQAREDIEKYQGRQMQNAAGMDFQRNFVIMMYMDYVTQRSFIRSVIPLAKDDPELSAYLKDSLVMHEEGIKALQGYLKRYEWK